MTNGLENRRSRVTTHGRSRVTTRASNHVSMDNSFKSQIENARSRVTTHERSRATTHEIDALQSGDISHSTAFIEE